MTPSPPPAPDAGRPQKGEAWLRQVVLDRTGGVPLHLQLRASLRRAIESSMKHGDRLPAEEGIAEALQLSRATVRRALADLTAAGLLERRRPAGTVVRRAERAGTLSQVAVITPEFDWAGMSVNAALLGALDRKRRELGADLRILRFKQGEEWKSFERLIPFRPEEGGVILLGNPPVATADLHRILSDREYPVVNVDAFYEGFAGAYVGVCQRTAIRLGLRHLKKLGHARIAFLVAEPEESEAVRERCRHFEREARSLGLREAHVVHGGLHFWENAAEAAARAMPGLWESDGRPTAIFAISDYAAFGALQWLQRQGVRVPDDVSLLSFDGTALCRMVQPPLTSLTQPLDRIAAETFRLLASLPASSGQVLVPPVLTAGGSTAPPPSAKRRKA